MKKLGREMWHYLILIIVLTLAVFLIYFISTLTPLMDWINSAIPIKIFLGWLLLAFLYAFTIGIVLVPSDLILHKLLKI